MFRQLIFIALLSTAHAAPPRDALPPDAAEWPLNYRLHLDGTARVRLSDSMSLAPDANGPHDIAIEHLAHSTPEAFRFTSTDFNSYVTVSTAAGAPQRVNGFMEASRSPGLGITPKLEVLGKRVVEVQ